MQFTRHDMFARALELYISKLESLSVDKDIKITSSATRASLEVEVANAKKALEQILSDRPRGPNLRHTLCRAVQFYRNLLEEEEATVASMLGKDVNLPIHFKNQEIKVIDSAVSEVCSEHNLNQFQDATAAGYKVDE